jgi:hypothetical protein
LESSDLMMELISHPRDHSIGIYALRIVSGGFFRLAAPIHSQMCSPI